MNDKFDELAKAMAQPVARRAALKKFGVGLVGAALAVLGLGNAQAAGKGPKHTCCYYRDMFGRGTYVCRHGNTQCPTLRGLMLIDAYPVSDCADCQPFAP